MTAFEYHIWKRLFGASMAGLTCVMLVRDGIKETLGEGIYVRRVWQQRSVLT